MSSFASSSVASFPIAGKIPDVLTTSAKSITRSEPFSRQLFRTLLLFLVSACCINSARVLLPSEISFCSNPVARAKRCDSASSVYLSLRANDNDPSRKKAIFGLIVLTCLKTTDGFKNISTNSNNTANRIQPSKIFRGRGQVSISRVYNQNTNAAITAMIRKSTNTPQDSGIPTHCN